MTGCSSKLLDHGDFQPPEPTVVGSPKQSPARHRGSISSWKDGGSHLAGGNDRIDLARPELYLSKEKKPDPVRTPVQAVAVDGEGKISLNFVNATIPEVVNGVLGDILEANYVVDPEVDGSVTARTAKPVPKTDVLAILENLLALNQAALIKTNGIWHVVPSSKAKTISGSVVLPRNRAEARGLGVHIIPLSYTTVSSVIEVVQGQINPDRQLVGDARRNLLIFVGPAAGG